MMHESQCEMKLYGFYRGVVLKHLSNGRCKIWIPTVYPDEWNSYDKADLLPSAEQASSLAFGANNGNGVFSYPNIDSIVWCFFERGDQNFPIYFASTLGGKDNAFKKWDESLAMAGSHPDDAYVHHIEAGTSHIYVYESGFIKVVTHNSDKSSKCTMTLDASGNITLDGSNTITLNAKNIVLNGSTQIDILAPNIKQNASVQSYVKSPAIQLDSSNGHTKIVSRAEFSKQNPAITTF